MNKILIWRCLVVTMLVVMTACSNYQMIKGYRGVTQPKTAVAEIQLPKEIHVFAINDLATDDEAAVWMGAKSKLHLLPGKNELVLRYASLWDNEPFGITKVRSALVGTTIEVVPGEEYEVRTNRPIRNYQDAEKFSLAPVFEIVRKHNDSRSVIATASTIVITEAARVAQVAPEYVEASLSEVEDVRTPEIKRVSPPTPKAAKPIQSLKESWDNATEAEREELIRSLVEK